MSEVYVCGLATDYCVKFTALDAVQTGFKTYFIEDASRGVNLGPHGVKNAIEEMKRAKIAVVQSVIERARGESAVQSRQRGPACSRAIEP